MIYADLEDLGRYTGLSANFAAAVEFLKKTDLRTLGLGRTDIDGDKVYVNHMSYESQKEEDCFVEAHLEYADIQIVTEGEEKIGVSHMSVMTVTETDKAADFLRCEGPTEHWMEIRPGKALVLFPEDTHKVKVRIGEPKHIEKFVVKVQL